MIANSIATATNPNEKTKLCVFSLVLMTQANDELQTGVVSEQTDPSAANTFITNQLTENNDGQWSPQDTRQDAGPAESGKTEEKVITFVKKVND